ncbi:hypothetical protein ESO86_08460, partial [Agromyces binzhouensis]
MSGDVLGAIAGDLADAIGVVRPRSDAATAASIEVEEAVATALLGFVSEPGDGVLGRLVGALGARPVATGLLGGRSGAEFAEQAAAHDPGGLDGPSARELTAGLARWRPRLDEAAFSRSVA